MKFSILALIIFATAPIVVSAQYSLNKAYAITSKTNGGHEWTEVKQIDLDKGQVIKNVFENNHGSYTVFDGRTSRQMTITQQFDSTKEELNPFAGLSAACAFDPKLNRLYYAPLFINQLRYIDLNSSVPSVYLFKDEKFSNAAELESEEYHITRMVIASDGNGYAMSNNGSHLVRFTTDKNPLITDLGMVHDAPENGEISIRDPNTSWGGDMLADASGSLYVISALNYVFKIDVQRRSAHYIAKIENLPIGFTSNGAVVDEQGMIVLSSANFLTSYYKVDPQTWEASALSSSEELFNTSDLANGNLLFQTKLKEEPAIVTREKISLYPNPVRSNVFWINFENKATGKYNVQLTDVTGRAVADKAISVTTGTQVSEIRLDMTLVKGMYFVKVLNHTNREVFTKKVIVE